MHQHRHLQVNIKQTMKAKAIRADVRRAFQLNPDTIVFNEAVRVTHAAIRAEARERGYGVYIPQGSASQVVLVWRESKYRAAWRKTTKAMGGRKHVSPNRYVVRVQLTDRETGETVMLVGTHMVSSGWTGSKWLDAWRQRGWFLHERVMAAVLRWVYRHNDVVIWSGDLNRPPYTFRGRVLPKYRIGRAKTSLVLRTDHTHGRTTFDYTGVLSKHRVVQVKSVSTPAFRSDHDGILTDLFW